MCEMVVRLSPSLLRLCSLQQCLQISPVHTHTHTYTHTHTHMHMHTCTHAPTHMHPHTHIRRETSREACKRSLARGFSLIQREAKGGKGRHAQAKGAPLQPRPHRDEQARSSSSEAPKRRHRLMRSASVISLSADWYSNASAPAPWAWCPCALSSLPSGPPAKSSSSSSSCRNPSRHTSSSPSLYSPDSSPARSRSSLKRGVWWWGSCTLRT